MRKIMPPTYLLAALLLILLLHFVLPIRMLIRLPWTLLGLVPLLLGVGLNLRANRDLRQHQTTVKPFQASAALVTEGAHQISRHPMYLGLLLILLSVSLLLGSLTPFVVPVGFLLLMESLFIRKQEKGL